MGLFDLFKRRAKGSEENEKLWIRQLNGKYGYTDKAGKKVTPFKYDEAWSFSEGLAVVKLNGKSGYIDKTGKEVIPFKYDFAHPFSEGLAYVRLNGKYGFIDKTGKEVIPFKYDFAHPFSEGLAHVRLNGKSGFIDKTGKEVIPFKYDFAHPFSEGLACVQLNEDRFKIDKNGNRYIPSPVPSSAADSAGNTSEQKADNGERGDKIEFDKIMIPFTTPDNGFYDEKLEESKNIALQQMMSSGSEGEQYLMNFILKDVSITDGYFLLRYYGDQAHSEWAKKCRIIDAFANSKDKWVINKLNEFVLCKGKENQFAVYFQPRVAETLGKLKQYNSLEKLAESGQVVPAVLLAKDIVRLHRLGTVDNPENIRDQNGYTPLQNAVYNADSELIKQLLNKGADIDQICSRGENLGRTALYMAVERKNLELVKLLLSYKANPKLPDLYGAFPLQKAAAMGLFDIVKALMENGADKNQKTLTGKTPLMWAEQNGHRNVAQYLRDV